MESVMNDAAFIAGYLSKEAGLGSPIKSAVEGAAGSAVGKYMGKNYITPTISKTIGAAQEQYKGHKAMQGLQQAGGAFLDAFKPAYNAVKGLPGQAASALSTGVSAAGDLASTGVDKLKKYHADVVRRQINAKMKGGLMKYGPAVAGGLGLLMMLLMSRNKQPQQMMAAMPRGWQSYPQLMPAQGAWRRGR